MIKRRCFLARGLRDSTLIALAPTLPGFLARTARAAGPEKDGRILVVVQLDGGNDGINTVVPFRDEGYAKYRQALRLPEPISVELTVSADPTVTTADPATGVVPAVRLDVPVEVSQTFNTTVRSGPGSWLQPR